MPNSRVPQIVVFKSSRRVLSDKPWHWCFMSRGEVKARSATGYARSNAAKTAAAAVAKAMGSAEITVKEEINGAAAKSTRKKAASKS